MTDPANTKRDRATTNRRDPAATKRGADPTVPGKPSSKRPADSSKRPAEERALEQGLEESMAGSDPPSIVQPGKNFVGPKG
jgi:hypothetical protein